MCGSREMRAKRQVVECGISQIKLFNAGSGWRTLTCVLVYGGQRGEYVEFIAILFPLF